MRAWLFTAGISAACVIVSSCPPQSTSEASFSDADAIGRSFHPNIVAGQNAVEDIEPLQNWIDETLSILKSDAFENNLIKASETYPQVYISRERDVIPSEKLLDLLHTRDQGAPNLWWPKSYVVLTGKSATRSPDRSDFGFEAVRTAGTGPYPPDSNPALTGEIELGRLHFARYTRGDVVEKSCAINTMAHEISHTLSDEADAFWMHILDTGDESNPPDGIYEASYFIGTVAQCTYLQMEKRISEAGFQNCLLTFSDPTSGSRFKSRACDDFPDEKTVTPKNRN